MNKLIRSTAVPTRELKLEAIANISASFELLCLASGMEALGEMMEHDAQAICGPRHARGPFRRAHRWGKTKGKIGFHGGNIEIERPRLDSVMEAANVAVMSVAVQQRLNPTHFSELPSSATPGESLLWSGVEWVVSSWDHYPRLRHSSPDCGGLGAVLGGGSQSWA